MTMVQLHKKSIEPFQWNERSYKHTTGGLISLIMQEASLLRQVFPWEFIGVLSLLTSGLLLEILHLLFSVV